MAGTQVSAQLRVAGSLGPATLVGSGYEGFQTGFSLNTKVRYRTTEHTNLGLNIGFYSNATEAEVNGQPVTRLSYLPITAALDYMLLSGEIRPYGSLNLGYAPLWITNNGAGGGTETNGELTGGIDLGVEFSLNNRLAIDLFARYQLINTNDNTTGGGRNLNVLAPQAGLVYEL
jgi:hypothetical protein